MVYDPYDFAIHMIQSSIHLSSRPMTPTIAIFNVPTPNLQAMYQVARALKFWVPAKHFLRPAPKRLSGRNTTLTATPWNCRWSPPKLRPFRRRQQQ